MSPICWYLSGACLPSRPVASPAARCSSLACSPLASAAPPTSPVFVIQCHRQWSTHPHTCSRKAPTGVGIVSAHHLSMTVLLQHSAHCLPAHQKRLSPSLTCVDFMPSARALIEVCQHDCSLPSCCLLLQHPASHPPCPSMLYQGCLHGEHAAVCAFSKRTLSRTDMHEAHFCTSQHVSSHPQMFAADLLELSQATASKKDELLPFAGSLIEQARCECAAQHSCL